MGSVGKKGGGLSEWGVEEKQGGRWKVSSPLTAVGATTGSYGLSCFNSFVCKMGMITAGL